ncbi:MAG: DUF4410 domain-containing protein [Verrucomicrobiota bacterium]
MMLATCLGFISGCASVSVENEQKLYGQGGEVKPEVIYVMPFATNGEFNVDREGVELIEFKRNLQEMMMVALQERFPKHLVTTTTAQNFSQIPHGKHWVVAGRFTLVNQGSRALRAVVGFGAGGTKVETEVYVYDAAIDRRGPFMRFQTTGGSGAQPGAVTSLNPVGAAVSAVGGAAKGLSEDVVRTSRMITATLSEYMFKRGWIPESQRLEAKR